MNRRTMLEALGTAAVASSITTAHPTSKTREQDPKTLSPVSEVSLKEVHDVVTQGTHAYVSTGEGFAVIDWASPECPQVVATVDAPGAAIWDVKVDGDLLAVSSQGDRKRRDGGDFGVNTQNIGTHFYDISDPADPQRVGTWNELPNGIHNHYLVGDTAFLAREDPYVDSELKILDISDPSTPELLSTWRVERDVDPKLNQKSNFLHDVYVQGDYAYLPYWDAGTRVLDVSDPATPTEVSSFGETADARTVPTSAEEGKRRFFTLPGNVHTSRPSPTGDYVYYSIETFPKEAGIQNPGTDDYGGVAVYNVTDFGNPQQVAYIDPPDVDAYRTAHNFDVTDTRLYVGWSGGGVRVFDITTPGEPNELANYVEQGADFGAAREARGHVVAADGGKSRILFFRDTAST